ncbi:hypothetical protein [Subtercola frigoramans]|uniref:Uncharacterized protein n=1 Tax=Subtercola frigoramans TaxID=120298 RepID=A0ABS2L2H3_9MICO|nr:hypothetical protein [Subtercola frigoramans]MBM7471293.1 hypothetical protein [Subtercola frigoramans]
MPTGTFATTSTMEFDSLRNSVSIEIAQTHLAQQSSAVHAQFTAQSGSDA